VLALRLKPERLCNPAGPNWSGLSPLHREFSSPSRI
jgi:hypothetical protein